ncbi:uncharacterized protein LOC135849627 [Planococcus citri]|uniref:uncharacterized protein LOC135849627 n=1 Tax=Planococcus citri TaxID=170843 RepID=UPI0031F9CE92
MSHHVENVEILDSMVIEEEKSENQCSQSTTSNHAENEEILDNIVEIEIDEEKSENQCSQSTVSNHVENVEILDNTAEIEMEEEKSEYDDEEKSEEEEGSKDSDEDSDEEDEDAEEDEEEAEEEEDDYYYSRKRHWDYYDDHVCKECKKCKNDDAYVFVTINPVILTNVPKLMDMASVVAAATLWNHVNISRALSKVTDRCAKETKKWNSLCGKVIALTDQLPVPKPIAEHITGYIRIMTKQIIAWVSYHYRTVFLKCSLDKYVYSLVYHIAWYPTGAINCAQTARNMMTSMRLSDVEKFRFLSVYCLKDEMDRMPTSLYSDHIRDYPNFQEYPMIFYWYCFYRNKLSKISRIIGHDQTLSIDVYMLRNSKVDNWSAKEYFFDQLNLDEQVREAIWLIDKHASVYQKAVMLKLNEMQREHVYMERATKIIVNYARPQINSRFILQTWFEARNLMNQNEFLTLVRDLLSLHVKGVILTKIWTSASDNFKQHVVGFNDHEIVRKVLTEWKWRDDYEFVFVLLHDSSSSIKKSITTKRFFNTFCERLIENRKFKVLHRLLEFCLSDANDLAEFKTNFVSNSGSKFFYTRCEKLLMNCKFEELSQLLECFLPDAEDSLQFKRNFVNDLKSNIINVYCENLLSNSKFQELDRLLEYCFSGTENLAQFKLKLVRNSEQVRKTCLKFYTTGDLNGLNYYLEQLLASYPNVKVEYKKNLITSSDGFALCVSIMDASATVDILNMVLEDSLTDSILITQYKKTMVFSSEGIIKLQKLLKNKRLDAVQLCINRYLTSNGDKKALKKQVIGGDMMKMMKAVLHNNDESYLQTVLIWCFGNDNAVQEFKRTLPLNTIFIKMLKDCVFYEYHHYLTQCSFKRCQLSDFNVLERFLNWYFQSPDQVKEYKMKIIHSYSKIDMFQTCLRGNRGDMQLRTVLQWFFKNDAAEIAKFKKLGGKITQLV